ncbi:MAG: AAA domain-containing protein [Gemmatimonadetes bacterium]|nr:AAA domain-containing protein [Gemmatimonadota bacterium]MYI61642.1 AAA domain-containing protein [Gemmatimonadota bacterium]
MNDASGPARTPRQRSPFDRILGHQYTVFDGLAGMQVEDIYQDQRGLLWIATADGGVSRFDGAHFDTFGLSDGLPSLTVMTIAEDQDGRLLFGTLGGGLAAYDGRGFQVYTTEHGLPSNDIVSLQPQADGSMRVLTGAGMGWFAEGRCVERVTEIAGQSIGRVFDMATDAAGTTWLATMVRGVISLDGRHLSAGNGAMQWPWKFAQDTSGLLWIAFRYVGTEAVIGRYDPDSQQLDFIKADAAIEGTEAVNHGTRHVRLDDRGWLWMTRRGVLVYDGEEWHLFSAGLPDIHFSDARLTYEDREGNIWVGLWSGGLVFCDPVSVQLYTEDDGLPDREVQQLSEDHQGRVWIGTMGGLACLEDGRIRPVETGNKISELAIDRAGEVWRGSSENEVIKGVGKEAQVIEVAKNQNAEEIILYPDQDGRMRVGTTGGCFGRIEDDRFIAEKQGPTNCRIALQDSEGTLWVGSYGETPALHYCNKGGHFHASDIAGIETVGYVSALCDYEGTLWIGTANGLFAFDYRAQQVRRFTADQGDLSVNGVMALVADPQQECLWIGTSGGGVLKYDGRVFQSIRLGKSTLENIVEAILRDSRGRLWFGTRAGLIAYQPGDTPPGIVIRQVMAGRLLEMPQAVSCPDSTPEIQFHFQGLSFRSGAEQMRYSHRLVGHGPAEEWSAFTSSNRVSYNRVPAGQFHFEVRALDRDGLMSEVVSLDVQVFPDEKSVRLQRLEHMLQDADQDFLSQSQAMTQLLGEVAQMAETDMTMLVMGETGVGKGVLAQRIHSLSRRRGQPFVALNCGSLPAGLIESELFGHERGAFTGAVKRHIGCFERANYGTLFLDEIGDLPLEAQRALLRILENRYLTRVGGEQSIPVDVRVIAATNKDLKEAIEAGTFREDLFYRLSAWPVKLPPLRERREDIPLLTAHFARRYAQSLQRPVPGLGDGVVKHLQEYAWPGNVRELEHLIRRAVVLCQGEVIQVEDVPLAAEDEAKEGPFEPPVEAKFKGEKQQIVEALQASEGRIYGERGAARLLGMNPERLRSRMRVFGLQRPKKRS